MAVYYIPLVISEIILPPTSVGAVFYGGGVSGEWKARLNKSMTIPDMSYNSLASSCLNHTIIEDNTMIVLSWHHHRTALSGFRAVSERFQSTPGQRTNHSPVLFRLVDAFPCAISSVFVTSEQNRGGLLTRGICPLITGARYGASSSSFDALLSCLYRYSPAPRSAASLRHLLLVSRTLAASFTL